MEGLRYAGDRPSVSVVVPTWAGSAAWIGRCLRALRGQCGPAPEVVVVLDGPCPEVEREVRAVLPAARTLKLKENKGFATAASSGLRVARGALVALLNDDCEPEPPWIDELVAAAARAPDAGSFASLVLDAGDAGRIDSAGHGLTRWGEAFEIGHGAPFGPPWDSERWVFGAPGSAAMYRHELLQDTHGLDEQFGAYLEDVDLSLRAQLQGFPCLFVPSARVRHSRSSSYGWGRGSGRAEGLLARNRPRLLARGFPIASWTRAGSAILASAVVDTASLALRGGGVGAVRGAIDGVRMLPAAWATRASTLGPRRIDDAELVALLAESEKQLGETLAARSGLRPHIRRAWIAALARATAGSPVQPP